MWIADRREIEPGRVSRPLWGALRAAKRPVTSTQLHLMTASNPASIDGRLRMWVNAGFVEASNSHPRRYKMSKSAPDTDDPPLIKRDGKVGKKPPVARQRIWNAIRILKRFDIVTLKMTCNAPERTIKHYVDDLRQAGFIRRVSDERWAGVPATYALVLKSGPIAPKRRGRALEDLNNNTLHPLVTARSRAARNN